ncbi:hypothetical protein [Streptomyces sp. NPDC051561]|uniref:hypothetical protein n=1 Tax=Streptomyces sp. NPDC051561 TaxID=3365658 RepID=UPI0037A0352C
MPRLLGLHDMPGCLEGAVADLKLFSVEGECARELRSQQVLVERDLQRMIERNMETLLGVRFLASEFSTGDQHGGRID